MCLIQLFKNADSVCLFFFFSSRRRHTRLQGDWSSDVCSSDLPSLEQRQVCWERMSRLRWMAPSAGARRCRLPEPGGMGIWKSLFTAISGILEGDRKSTRLNSSHLVISYAVFCLKKKK